MTAAVYGLYKDMPVQSVDLPPPAGSEPGLFCALPSRLPRRQMAAFSYQHRLLFAPALDPSYALTPPFELPLPQLHQHPQAGLASWLPCQHPSTAAGPAAAATESSSSFSGGSRTVPSGDHWVASSSCSSAQMTEGASSEMPNLIEKKRNERQRRRAGTAQPNDAKEPRNRKQKNCRVPATEPPSAEKKRKTGVRGVPPAGYIHVRARRGQATDSHSLAERARREKIGERMKMLQGLVPGCDKVVGKALVLDEIINYVQSLQHQVEFLSMKLAAANPVFHDSCFDLEFMSGYGLERPERSSPSLLSAQQAARHIQVAAFTETAINCPVPDTSIPFLLHGQGPNAIPQDSGNSFVMQMGENRQTFFQ